MKREKGREREREREREQAFTSILETPICRNCLIYDQPRR